MSDSRRLAIHGGAPVRTRPFPSWPIHDEREETRLLDVLRSGNWWRYSFGQGVELSEPDQGSRSQVAAFQEEFARAHGCQFGIAAANGTATLEMGLRAMNLEVGDEIIMPAYTYVASASSVLQNNAVPIFVDVREDTLNLDAERLDEAITPRTRAIMVVHFAGQPADMDAIDVVAARRGIPIIVDAAHAHGAEWKGQSVGSQGLFSSFSFQATKNMTAGEGGILCTNDRSLAAECDSLTWCGRRPGRPWYEFHRLGWNYRLTEFQAAILRVQLERLFEQTSHREQMARYLSDNLAKIPGVVPLVQDPRCTRNAYHLYIVRYQEDITGLSRKQFVQALNGEGIPAATGYTHPVYRNPMFLEKRFVNGSFPFGTAYHDDVDYGAFAERCPVTERMCVNEAVWLPHPLLLGTREDVDDVVLAVEKVLAARDLLRGDA